jgi:hypothetical protein
MTQALYAHMNNKTIKKKLCCGGLDMSCASLQELVSSLCSLGLVCLQRGQLVFFCVGRDLNFKGNDVMLASRKWSSQYVVGRSR